jgi:starch phosphorylase
MLDQLDLWNPNPLPPLPAPLERLGELAYNLWWSWQPAARSLFEHLDPAAWDSTNHNPIVLLRNLPARRLRAAAGDPAYVERYAAVMAAFDGYMAATDTAFARAYPTAAAMPAAVAYFSAEFGVHESLPVYSGGLGVLAGDHCKAASDLGLPLVGVGLLYPQGYFSQTLDETGHQEAHYEKLGLDEAPLRPAILRGEPVIVEVSIAARSVRAQVWYARVGRVVLLLLDTDIATNPPRDREVGYKLYGGGPGNRLRQEMLLGLGGARALAQLGLAPPVWHLNEGHAAFAPLERIRQRVARGEAYEAAHEAVAATTVFTTHTPVRAGHDEFSPEFILAHFDGYAPQLGLGEPEFLDLGRRAHDADTRFSMTTLAFHLSGWHNAVSQLHGEVTRRMWHDLWPERAVEDVPVLAITNGVHRPTWQATVVRTLLDATAGLDTLDDGAPAGGEAHAATLLPDAVLWSAHTQLKELLVDSVRAREAARRERLGADAQAVAAAAELLDPAALTIGFARRFATYKRATLIFRDPARLARLVNDPARPLQLLFAGKAHPADEGGQAYLAEVFAFSQRPEFAGRVVVLEGYDMHLARQLTHGVDVWLNTPRKPHEASGTSGMKAALNGVPNLSVLDGWWAEGYRGDNGWAISGEDAGGDEATDARDAEALYRLLEEDVVPDYYHRDGQGLPARWLPIMRAAMAGATAMFTAERMVAEYAAACYVPALERAREAPRPVGR